MASTSGLATFNLDLSEIVEEAFERCGSQLRSGYDLRTARRSLNMLSIEWANRGINLWTIEQGQILLNTGQTQYALPIDTIDLLDQVIRNNNSEGNNQIDINITRISESTYITIPNKLANGRPIQVWINRQSGQTNVLPSTVLDGAITSTDTTITVASVADLATSGFVKIDSEIICYQNIVGNQLLNCFRGQANTTAALHNTGASVYTINLPSINVWPSPNSPGNQYTFVYYRMRRIQDAGSGVNIGDIPFRLIPCLAAGLAFYLSSKLPDIDPLRVQFLKQEYEQQWLLASQEDREKAADRFVPRQLFY
jgi:hypothetical protein